MAKQKRFIFFGAHPDDCELRFGGTALRLTQAGHLVKFVSCCNGDKGHQSMTSEGLAARRYAEAARERNVKMNLNVDTTNWRDVGSGASTMRIIKE